MSLSEPMIPSARLAARRKMNHLELDPLGILEEDRVVAGRVLGEVAGRTVERGQPARLEKLSMEPIDVRTVIDAEGDVIQSGTLAVEAGGVVRGVGRHQPEVDAAVGEAGDAGFRGDDAVLEITEQRRPGGQRGGRVAEVDLEVID